MEHQADEQIAPEANQQVASCDHDKIHPSIIDALKSDEVINDVTGGDTGALNGTCLKSETYSATKTLKLKEDINGEHEDRFAEVQLNVQVEQCMNNLTDHGGSGEPCALISLNNDTEIASDNKEEVSDSGELNKMVNNQTHHPTSEKSSEADTIDWNKCTPHSSRKIDSESPFDTKITKDLMSRMELESSQDALLDELESEYNYFSTESSVTPSLPNGITKESSAVAIFNESLQNKCLQQENKIKK